MHVISQKLKLKNDFSTFLTKTNMCRCQTCNREFETHQNLQKHCTRKIQKNKLQKHQISRIMKKLDDYTKNYQTLHCLVKI